MKLLPIVKYGDPILRRKTAPVQNIDGALINTINDMFTTMYAAPGIGLSANQVGISKCFAVIDLRPEGRRTPLVIINPIIEERSGTYFEEEGCLSVPGFSARVRRAVQVQVSAINEKGLPIRIEAEGLMARCLQHEIDHLNGRLFFDSLSLIQRFKIKRQIASRKKSGLF